MKLHVFLQLACHLIIQGNFEDKNLAAEHVLFFKSRIFQHCHMLHFGMAFYWIPGPSIFEIQTPKSDSEICTCRQMRENLKKTSVKSQVSKTYFFISLVSHLPLKVSYSHGIHHFPSLTLTLHDHLDLWPWTLWRGRKFAISGQPYSASQGGCWSNMHTYNSGERERERDAQYHKKTYTNMIIHVDNECQNTFWR